ncbi:MAG: EAL domain-containing protein [Clostridiales bacterium]|jgi:EAL domain-containing protein (putative c-di-GMP-specific phosphodiesterase class I)|nr:EAL domain-containing protein [Clostridiales bacterium]
MATPHMSALIKETVESGVEPLTTLISPVRRCMSREIYAFRTIRQINSVQLGVLRPSQYRIVCDRTRQSVRLALSDLEAAIKLAKQMESDEVEFSWISVYLPIKMLKRKNHLSSLENLVKEYNKPQKICLELSSDILFEDLDNLQPLLNDIKLLGFKIGLSAFGGDFCPMSRMYGLNADICFFEPSVATKCETSLGNRLAGQITAFVKSAGCEPVACVPGTMPKSAKPDEYSKAGFAGFTSSDEDMGEWYTYGDFRDKSRGEGL